jgi:hypothetical protein
VDAGHIDVVFHDKVGYAFHDKVDHLHNICMCWISRSVEHDQSANAKGKFIWHSIRTVIIVNYLVCDPDSLITSSLYTLPY